MVKMILQELISILWKILDGKWVTGRGNERNEGQEGFLDFLGTFEDL